MSESDARAGCASSASPSTYWLLSAVSEAPPRA